MAQYKTGTVNVTNGSSTVELIGGAAIANIGAGDLFIVSDPALNGAGVPYIVASTPGADDSFSLTAPWAGDTATGRAYAVHRDFVDSIPLMNPDDIELPALFNRAMQVIFSGLGGGGGGGSLPSFSGHAKGVVAVNEAELAVEYLDHRFLGDKLAELAPTALSGRLVHYSMVSGMLSESAGRADEWNDISGNDRHATADSIGPRVVGEAPRASYGLNFNSSSDASDDVMMISTVPASQNTMFLFVVGRCDPKHSVSRNLLKTAHAAGVDSQTAGDIELAAAGSGDALALRITTSASAGQLISLPGLKNGQPFAVALALNSGNVTGWIAGQHQTPREISTTYQHGSGFDTDRLRLGQSVDEVTAQTLHEVLLASTIPSAADVKRLVLWARNRYFRAQLLQDESDPRVTAPVQMNSHHLIGPVRPLVTTDGTDIVELLSPSRALAVANAATAAVAWSGAAFVHSGLSDFALTLPATAPVGWELDVTQQGGTEGSVALALATGATNQNSFGLSVDAGTRLSLRVVANSDGSSAAYAGYSSVGSGGGVAAATPTKVLATPTTGIYALSTAVRYVPEHVVLVTAADNTDIEVPDGFGIAVFKILVRHDGCSISIAGDPSGRVINGVEDGAAIGLGPSGATVTLFCLGSDEIQSEGEFVAEATALADVDMAGHALRNALIESEPLNTPSSSSGTLAVDLASGNQIGVALSENITTHTLSNVPATGRRVSVTYRIVQDSTDRTMVWPAAFDWGTPGAPALSSGDGAVTIVTAFTDDGGATWHAMLAWSE